MAKYPDINNINFQEKIKEIFREYKIKDKKQTLKDFCYPKKYTFQLPQLFVAEYLNPKTPYKGILLYHRIGAGKTCTVISIAEAFKTKMNVIVVLPASLIGNFRSELRSECGGNIYMSESDRNIIKGLKSKDKLYKKIIKVIFLLKYLNCYMFLMFFMTTFFGFFMRVFMHVFTYRTSAVHLMTI